MWSSKEMRIAWDASSNAFVSERSSELGYGGDSRLGWLWATMITLECAVIADANTFGIETTLLVILPSLIFLARIILFLQLSIKT